jgi:hypothetical protein
LKNVIAPSRQRWRPKSQQVKEKLSFFLNKKNTGFFFWRHLSKK